MIPFWKETLLPCDITSRSNSVRKNRVARPSTLTSKSLSKVILNVVLMMGFSLHSATYYVSELADPGGDGSVDTPFDELSDVAALSLNHGDIVRFERGSIWLGTMEIRDESGSATAPITFTDYGDPQLPAPFINGQGEIAAVILSNCSHFVFENFRICLLSLVCDDFKAFGLSKFLLLIHGSPK